MQNVLNALICANLITPVDSPTGRRWGHRDAKTGKIVEAYGFDLSPIGLRHAEFVALAERAAAEERERAALRRRLTIARKAIQQIAETALEHRLTDRDWHYWLAEALTLVLTIRDELPLEGLQAVVAELEQRRAEGEAALRAAFDSQQIAPAGAIECTPITTTTQPKADNSATGNIDSEKPRNGQGDSPASPDPVFPERFTAAASCRDAKVRSHRLSRAEALHLYRLAQLGRHRRSRQRAPPAARHQPTGLDRCLPSHGTLPSGYRGRGDRRQRRDHPLARRLPQGNDQPRPERRAAPEQQPLGPRPARAFPENLRCVRPHEHIIGPDELGPYVFPKRAPVNALNKGIPVQ